MYVAPTDGELTPRVVASVNNSQFTYTMGENRTTVLPGWYNTLHVDSFIRQKRLQSTKAGVM